MDCVLAFNLCSPGLLQWFWDRDMIVTVPMPMKESWSILLNSVYKRAAQNSSRTLITWDVMHDAILWMKILFTCSRSSIIRSLVFLMSNSIKTNIGKSDYCKMLEARHKVLWCITNYVWCSIESTYIIVLIFISSVNETKAETVSQKLILKGIMDFSDWRQWL